MRWWQGNGFEGVPPRPSLIVENRSQALAAACAGSGLTITDARYVGAPGPYNAIGRLQARE
jgi:hypothetical protein